jgi:hypothetical protein
MAPFSASRFSSRPYIWGARGGVDDDERAAVGDAQEVLLGGALSGS